MVYGVCVAKWVSVALRVSSPYIPGGALHGHDYKVRVCVEGGLGGDNKVVDHLELLAQLEKCLRSINYRYLNEVLGTQNPTAELLAKKIADCLSGYAATRNTRIALVEVCTASELCSYYRAVVDNVDAPHYK